jgi:hypothetical protein
MVEVPGVSGVDLTSPSDDHACGSAPQLFLILLSRIVYILRHDLNLGTVASLLPRRALRV